MNKRVRLTWLPSGRRPEEGPVVEEVLLLDEDAPLFMFESFDSLGTVKDLIDVSPDYVLFEDDEGIFGVSPSQVIEITEL